MAQAAQKLQQLPDDGNIRMLVHDSSYHSHKHGYACDGIDVYVLEARVMKRDTYLELIREREDQLVQAIENEAMVLGRRRPEPYTKNLSIPDCTIITPNLFVSIPRNGTWHRSRDESDSWTPHTKIETRFREIFSEIDTHQRSPFQTYLTFNSEKIRGTPQELRTSGELFFGRLAEQFSAINSSLPTVQPTIDRLNHAHNMLCAESIEFRESLRQRTTAPLT